MVAKKKESKPAFSMAAIKAQIQEKLTNTKKPKKDKKPGDKNVKEEVVDSKDRIHTGVPGLDDVMEGGIRRGTVNLVGGGAGSGKSIFCMQFLVEGIQTHGEKGIYISFEETEDQILDNFRKFNWDLKELIKKKKLVILTYTPEQVEKVLRAGGGTVRDIIDSMKAKRLVIDSLTAFTLLHENDLDQRKACLKLFHAMEHWGVTTLMTSEQEPDPDKHSSTVMEFEVDGVILLYNIRKGDIRERSLEIFKMRGTEHAAKIFPMKISNDGVMIYPDQTVF